MPAFRTFPTRSRRAAAPFAAGVLVFAAVAAGAAGCGGAGASDSRGTRTPPRAPEGVDAGRTVLEFRDETADRGIDFVQSNGRSDERFFVEVLGSGAIFFDADGDGDPDLFLPNQTTIARPHAEPAPHAAFYVNDGTGRFTDRTKEAGLADGDYVLGVCGADVDNDGDVDLYLTKYDGPNTLYLNNSDRGDLTFTDATRAAGVEGPLLTDASCAFADVDNDGHVDLYVGLYVDHGRNNNPVCTRRLKKTREKVREYCTPRHFNPLPDVLFRNRGDGTFEDVSVSSGIAAASGRSLGVAFSDADLDGDQDLYVACDRTASLFYENDGTGVFRERAHESGIALSMDGEEEAGMGTAWGDYDGDGLPDLVKTNYEFEHNNLYLNQGGLRFVEMAHPAGTAASSFKYLAWGIDFLDADNDADLDLFVANGHLRDLSLYAQGPKDGGGYAQVNLIHENVAPGTFVSRATDAGEALGVELVSRGFAWADIDDDGDLDFVVSNLHGPARLHVNHSTGGGRWLKVRLEGTASNRSAIGARVVAELPDRSLTREVRSGQSYLSQSDLTLHFGLGPAPTVPRLTIHWPSGRTSVLTDVPSNQTLDVTEPA